MSTLRRRRVRFPGGSREEPELFLPAGGSDHYTLFSVYG